MPKNRSRSGSIDIARSKRTHGRKSRKRSRGRHTGQALDEAARRRPRDLDSGDDDNSADARPSVCTEIVKAQGPKRTLEVNAGSKSGRKTARTPKGHKSRSSRRVEDSGSGNDSSDTDTTSSTSDSSVFVFPPPDPYDGKADPFVFDLWKVSVQNWAKVNKLSRKEVMYNFSRLVTGSAESCFLIYVSPTIHSKKWKVEEVFQTIYKHCFPAGYKMRVHRQLVAAKQGNLRVLHFAGRIIQLANHVPYSPSKEFLATVFFEGLNGPIKERLILEGLMPGKVALELEALVEHARDFEDRLQRIEADMRRITL